MDKISDYKNIHPGKHVFIVASGPSLKEEELEFLNRRLTIGVNRSFMAFNDMYYHCVMDHRLFPLYEKELKNTRTLFTLEDRPFGIPLKLLGSEGFSWDLEEGIYSGYTISYFALQLAVYMGFDRIFFLGLDLQNKGKDTHFFGTDPRSSNHETTEYPKMLRSFESVAPMLQEKGVKVFNCSKESSLKCFEFMDLRKAKDI